MGAPTGADRRDRPGLRPARDADLAAAGEGLTQTGPMFRYDRPQAGRYRQFWQFDVEAIGDAGPAVDAEIVELGARFYREAGLDGVEVLLNSIGDAACRPAYIEELTAYYRGTRGDLPPTGARRASSATRCACSTRRTRRWRRSTPRRRGSPTGCATPCAEHFAAVRAHLDALGVAYRLEPGLVRGLDYYTRTAFEFYVRGARASSRRSAAAGATTAWSSCSAAGRRRGSGSASGSTGSSSRSRRPADAAAGAGAGRGRGRRRPGRHGRAAGDRHRAAGGRAGRPRRPGRAASSASSWRRPPATRAHFAVILGDELATGEVQLRDLPAGTQKLVARSDLARELAAGPRRPPPRDGVGQASWRRSGFRTRRPRPSSPPRQPSPGGTARGRAGSRSCSTGRSPRSGRAGARGRGTMS